MAERLLAVLISAALVLVPLGVDLVRDGDYLWGSVLVALGLACAAVATIREMPKLIRARIDGLEEEANADDPGVRVAGRRRPGQAGMTSGVIG